MNINEAQKILHAADTAGHVPLLQATHGIGKSAICAQYAAESKLHYEPLILSIMDESDLLGLPKIREVAGQHVTTYAAPDWYSRIVNAAWPESINVSRLEFKCDKLRTAVLEAKEVVKGMINRADLNRIYSETYAMMNDRLHIINQLNMNYLDSVRAVLFLDEFNRSHTSVLNASLQLILDGRLHSHILPIVNGKRTFIVAAINPADDDYTVNTFDPALLDRFVFCKLDTDTKAWLDYAKKNNVNRMVIDFIIDNPNKLHHTPKDGSKGASPRSWTRLAAYLDVVEQTDSDVMSYYIAGTIGDTLAAEFLMYMQNYSNNISMEDVIKFVKKEARKEKDVLKLGELVGDYVSKLEAIKQQELAEQLATKLGKETTLVKALPYIAYLHGLPLEILASYLSDVKRGNKELYDKLVVLDGEATNKQIFRKIIEHTLNKQ